MAQWREVQGAGRRPLVEAAIELLEVDGYRARLAGYGVPAFDGQPPAFPVPTDLVSVSHRAAVERTLTRAELAVVDQALYGEVWGCLADFLDREVGGVEPDDDEKLEALTLILGRRPRLGG